MEFIPAKLPLFVKHIFPKYTWNLPTEELVIYLTFDDGPTPEVTTWTLEVLEQYQAKATFFCVGNNVEKHSDILLKIAEKGHTIGNHTYNHPKGWRTSTEAYLKNVQQAQNIINFQLQKLGNNQASTSSYQTSKNHKLFRPPYGQITKKQGRKLMGLGYKIRSEEHTSELQSRPHLVCRLLLEKKKKKKNKNKHQKKKYKNNRHQPLKTESIR